MFAEVTGKRLVGGGRGLFAHTIGLMFLSLQLN